MYYANGSEGAWFDNQCSECAIPMEICPINFVQVFYNYDQIGNKLAEEIMDSLVNQNGCVLYPYVNKIINDLKEERDRLKS